MKFLGDIDTKYTILLDVKYGRNKTSDYVMLLFKNIINNKKFVINIPKPKVEIYFVKPEYRNFEYNQTAIERSKLDSVIIPYKDIIKVIADEAGGKYAQYRIHCLEERNYKALGNIFHYPYSFGADLDICDFYRCWWQIHYYNSETKIELHKAYLDIENDVIDYIGIPEYGKAPINMISVCDSLNHLVHTFCLRNASRPNPLIKEFEKNIDNFYKLCHDTFDEEFPDFKYQIYMFDDEKKLLETLFDVLNNMEPDFIGIWNMAYDIQNIIKRYTELGGDPEDLFCSKEFKIKKLNYWVDTTTGQPSLKKDYFDVTSKFIWTDMMLNYGKLRKNRAQLRSIKLDYIAKIELGSGKFSYSGNYDKNLPYTDYTKFVLYSIKDVLLLHGIESKTEDMNDILSRALLNGSSYKEIFSQTKFLKNRFYIECYKDEFIAGNNSNIDYSVGYLEETDQEEKFDGAVVGDPELNSNTGEKIFNTPSKYVFKYVIDMDFSSLYPWTIISFNISAKTMLGKLLIDNKYYCGNSKSSYEENPELKFECGKEFCENYLTKDIIRLGINFFNLPSIEEMVNELDENNI